MEEIDEKTTLVDEQHGADERSWVSDISAVLITKSPTVIPVLSPDQDGL
jgi:hypothetical protein